MTTFAVLATGQSMSQMIANTVRHLPRIAINDAYKLAPDADALCANDAAWWRLHKDALGFAGRKFSCATVPGVEKVKTKPGLIETSTNSALFGMHVGFTIFGWTRALLYGVDLHGTHFFGAHEGLNNTTPSRFEVFQKQFQQYASALPKGAEVFNYSTGSALRCFPFQS